MSQHAGLANTSKTRRSRWILSLSAGLAILLPAATMAMAADKNVNALTYFNNGGYTVKNIKLHWRSTSGGGDKEHTFGTDRTLGQAFCLDLQSAAKDMNIAEGDEVWLSFNISGGDRQQCKLDDERMLYSTSKTAATINFISGGTTLNNNRCKQGKGAVVVGKDSGNCEYMVYTSF